MKPTILFGVLLFCAQSFATDFCEEAIGKNHRNSGLGKMWKLENGKVTQIDTREGLGEKLMIQSEKLTNKSFKVTDTYLNLDKVETTVTTDHGVLKQVNSTFYTGSKYTTSRTDFEVTDANCVPTQLTTRDFGEADEKVIPKMCHELRTYLAKNPDAAACNCGNKESNAALVDIMRPYGFNDLDLRRISRTTLQIDSKSIRKSEPLYAAITSIAACKQAFPTFMRSSDYWSPLAKAPDGQGESTAVKEQKKAD